MFGPFQRAGKSADSVLWREDPEIGFAPGANLDTIAFTAEWVNRIGTDDFGFRITDAETRSDPPAPQSIVFLGDSQTMAVQLPAGATYVYLVE